MICFRASPPLISSTACVNLRYDYSRCFPSSVTSAEHSSVGVLWYNAGSTRCLDNMISFLMHIHYIIENFVKIYKPSCMHPHRYYHSAEVCKSLFMLFLLYLTYVFSLYYQVHTKYIIATIIALSLYYQLPHSLAPASSSTRLRLRRRTSDFAPTKNVRTASLCGCTTEWTTLETKCGPGQSRFQSIMSQFS